MSILRVGNKLWLEQNFSFSQLEAYLFIKSWIRGYQRFFITVAALRPLQNFGKHSWKQWLSVRFAAYAFIGYDLIGKICINDISIQIETSIQRCCTLLHWIVWHSLTMIYCSIRLYIFKSELTDCLSLLTKSMCFKQKR